MIGVTVLLPLVTAAVLASLPASPQAGSPETGSRGRGPSRLEQRVALLGALATVLFAGAGLLALASGGASTSTGLIERHSWAPGLGVAATFRIDGINIFPVIATTLLSCVTVLWSRASVQERGRLFLVASLALETALLGFFTALDAVLAVIFLESAILCAYAILRLGRPTQRGVGGKQLVLWLSASAACILVAALYVQGAPSQGVPTAGLAALGRAARTPSAEPGVTWLFLVVAVAGSAPLLPLFPADRWLAGAYRESSPPAAILLVGLLGIGVLGFARIVLPLFPGPATQLAPWLLALAVITVLVAAVRSFLESDGKGLVLRFSAAHLALALAGLLTFTVEGVVGALLLLVNHTLSATALYFLLGVLGERRLSQRIGATDGLCRVMPHYSRVLSVVVAGAVGILPACGFVGVYLVASGLAQRSGWAVATLALIGVLVIAASLVAFCSRLLLPPRGSGTRLSTRAAGSDSRPEDLGARELAAVLPLVLSVVMSGVFSTWFTDRMTPAVHEWLEAFR